MYSSVFGGSSVGTCYAEAAVKEVHHEGINRALCAGEKLELGCSYGFRTLVLQNDSTNMMSFATGNSIVHDNAVGKLYLRL